MKTKTIIGVSMLLAALALAVLGMLFLPQTLIMQITLSGEGGTRLPRLAGIAIAFALCALYPTFTLLKREFRNSLFISVIGFVFYAFIFIVNL